MRHPVTIEDSRVVCRISAACLQIIGVPLTSRMQATLKMKKHKRKEEVSWFM